MPPARPLPLPPAALLEVRDLSVEYSSHGVPFPALAGVSLSLGPGEVVGILGESGSGKSTLAQSLIGMLPRGGRIVAGSLRFGERDLRNAAERDWAAVRGSKIALISQDPVAALNPVRRVAAQIAEVLRAHRRSWHRDGEVEALLREVGFVDPADIARRHPHQLSGGQAQRVVIAQALACAPDVLLADEPTASLDAVAQREILDLLRRLSIDRGMALLIISHHPEVLAAIASRVIIMFGGHVIEEGALEAVATSPLHPCTKALMQAARSRERQSFRDEAAPAGGCVYAGRCSERVARCSTSEPPLVSNDETGRSVACFNVDGRIE